MRHVVVAMGDGEVARCRAECGETAEVIAVGGTGTALPLARARNAGAEHALARRRRAARVPRCRLPAGRRPPRALPRGGRAGRSRRCSAARSPTCPRRRPAATRRPVCARSPIRIRAALRRRRGARSAAATTRSSGRSPSPSPARPGGASAGSARSTRAMAARTPTSDSSHGARASTCAGSAAHWAFHQHHPVGSPPVQHLDDILRNAAYLPRPLGLVAHGRLAGRVRRARAGALRRRGGRVAARAMTRGTRRDRRRRRDGAGAVPRS